VHAGAGLCAIAHIRVRLWLAISLPVRDSIGVAELAEYLSDDFEGGTALSDELLRLIACDLSNRRAREIAKGIDLRRGSV
jgi:hypothetical protein